MFVLYVCLRLLPLSKHALTANSKYEGAFLVWGRYIRPILVPVFIQKFRLAHLCKWKQVNRVKFIDQCLVLLYNIVFNLHSTQLSIQIAENFQDRGYLTNLPSKKLLRHSEVIKNNNKHKLFPVNYELQKRL